MEKEKLIRQLFIGKVSDIIGINKTYELLKEAKNDLEYINKPLSYQKDKQTKEYKEQENKKYCSCHQSFKIQEVEDGDLICEFCRKLIKQ
jgi:hypothetical protein